MQLDHIRLIFIDAGDHPLGHFFGSKSMLALEKSSQHVLCHGQVAAHAHGSLQTLRRFSSAVEDLTVVPFFFQCQHQICGNSSDTAAATDGIYLQNLQNVITKTLFCRHFRCYTKFETRRDMRK